MDSEMLTGMTGTYLAAWHELQIALLHGEDPPTGEPFLMNVRLDVRHATGRDVNSRPQREIRCRIRVWAIEGNLQSPEIEHIMREVNKAAEQDVLHGLLTEVNNSGIEVKDVLLDA